MKPEDVERKRRSTRNSASSFEKIATHWRWRGIICYTSRIREEVRWKLVSPTPITYTVIQLHQMKCLVSEKSQTEWTFPGNLSKKDRTSGKTITT
jgi:hypothetical protein